MDQGLLDAVWDALPKLVASGEPVSACMRAIASVGKQHSPDDDWEQFLAIDYDASVEALHAWLPRALSEDPPQIPVLGLFLPLVQLDDVGYHIRLAGTREYDPADQEREWVCAQDYEPREQNRYAGPPALKELSTLSHDDAELDYVMPLAFVVTTVRALLASHTTALVNPDADVVGVVAGWEDGDHYEIGQLTRSGFRAETVARI